MVNTNTSISHVSGGSGYELTIVDMDCASSLFNRHSVVPTGHAWESVVRQYCEKNNLATTAIDFDSESDYFFAYSSERGSLQALANSIDALIASPEVLEKILNHLEREESYKFSLEEFVEDLRYINVNVGKPLRLSFYMELPTPDSVYLACSTASASGYECLLQIVEEPYQFAAIIDEIPTVQLIQPRIRYFEKLAVELGGEFIDCEETSSGNPLEVFATDWKQYDESDNS